MRLRGLEDRLEVAALVKRVSSDGFIGLEVICSARLFEVFGPNA